MKDDDSFDVALGPELDDGTCVGMRRNGDLFRCTPIRDGESVRPGGMILHVEAAHDGPWRKATTVYRSGPPQVATPEYRRGYDRIFGKQKVGVA